MSLYSLLPRYKRGQYQMFCYALLTPLKTGTLIFNGQTKVAEQGDVIVITAEGLEHFEIDVPFRCQHGIKRITTVKN